MTSLATSAAAVNAEAVVGPGAALEAPVVDEGQPKTTIAVRLASGKNFKAVLNLTHTVAHLHALIHG